MNHLAGKIADAELEVMHALWAAKEPLTVSEIKQMVEQRTGWVGSTVKTLLYRLQKKGVVESEQREVFYYAPLVTQEEYGTFTAKSMIDKVFYGSAKSLVAQLVKSNMLSDHDILELRSMLRRGKDE